MLTATLDETQESDAAQLRLRELLHLGTLARPSGQRLRLSLRKPPRFSFPGGIQLSASLT